MTKLRPAEAKRLLEKRRAMALLDKNKFVLENFLFKQQLDFVRDPARYAVAVTSVRAGKTTSCAADLIDTALKNPGTIGLYITLTRASAKRIVWPELVKINNDYQLKGKMDQTQLSITFPNRSIIYCSGANTDTEIEKFRGLSNVILVYIDESQAFRSHIKELVEDIIVKRLYDTNGRCRLIGTPGPVPAGYFYEASQSPQWSQHHWTMHDNPFLFKKSGLTPHQLIMQDIERKGVTLEDASIQRECFGRWELDTDSLILEYNPAINHYDELPLGNYNYIMGVDLGYEDADAICVLAYSDKTPTTYLVEEVITERQGLAELEQQIIRLMQKYQILKIRADAGGLGKKIVEDIRMRKGIPLEAAEKTEKMSNYSFLNNALRSGNFKAKKTSRFAQDCNLLQKDRDKSTPERIVVAGHSDAVDATLYAFKDSPAYMYTPPVKLPDPGTPEWYVLEEERMRQRALDEILEQKNRQFGDSFDPFAEPTIDLSPWRRT